MSSIDSFLSLYIEAIAKLLRSLRFTVDVAGISIAYEEEAQQSLDERIAKLDAAKKNLADGISAIEQLKLEAERSKTEVAAAALQVERLTQDKASLSSKLEAMQTVLSADVDAFRQVAGVPNAASIRRERIIGFISGVAASLVAAAVVWGGSKLLALFQSTASAA
jgi:chromosome segregation ATPase